MLVVDVSHTRITAHPLLNLEYVTSVISTAGSQKACILPVNCYAKVHQQISVFLCMYDVNILKESFLCQLFPLNIHKFLVIN